MIRILVISILCLVSAALSKEKGNAGFLTVDQLPDAGVYLPAPPDTADRLFAGDSIRYAWGKSLRGTERGRQAVLDADNSMKYLAEYFSDAFGLKIDKKKTPELYSLMNKVRIDGGNAQDKAKKKYMRKRPYVQFAEPTPVPGEEEKNRNTGSYPSGHTGSGWAMALVLAEINPDRQNFILERGYQYGESRVIVGFHYQSDVDAARASASAAVARLHADPEFQKQLAKAEDEVRKALGGNE